MKTEEEIRKTIDGMIEVLSKNDGTINANWVRGRISILEWVLK